MKLKEIQANISKSNYDTLLEIRDLKHKLKNIIPIILHSKHFKIPSFFDKAKYQLQELNNIISEYYDYAQIDTDEIHYKLTQVKQYFKVNYQYNVIFKEIHKLSKKDIEEYIGYYIRNKEDLSSVKDEFTDLHLDFEDVLGDIDTLCSAILHIHTKK